MSSQGALPGAGAPAFGLIETFRWSREAGFAYFEEHMVRLERSAGALRFAVRREAVAQHLAEFVSNGGASASRVGLVLLPDGSVEITASPLSAAPTLAYRVAIAGERHRSDDAWLYHKTTLRDRYERPLAAAIVSANADEVLFLNERDEVCEGARSNLFIRRQGQLLTPRLSCGLLPGTLRAHLLQAGKAREAVLSLADVAAAGDWYMGNSVRGLIPSSLVAR